VREVPRVAGFSGEEIVRFIGHKKFGSVGVSEEDGACGFQSADEGGVLLGHIVFAEKGAGGTGPSSYINAALDGKGHAN
jgi:hypothetical protein